MNMAFIMILSIGIKAVAAIVEIITQMLITNAMGVRVYGNYMFYVSLVEGTYFILYSGSVKLNTFYLSTPTCSLLKFKKTYFKWYVLPTILVVTIGFAVFRHTYGLIAGAILLTYYFAYDYSSVLLARGKQIRALIGEYLLGRVVFLVGILLIIHFDQIDRKIETNLFILYGLQFVVIFCFFIFEAKLLPKGTEDTKVSTRKLFEYQVSDIANSIVTYFPTILQYVLGGAFTAGFISVITVIKRIVTFISGPTAKVFLPEFSRLYKRGEKALLQQTYLMIVRIQMIFIGTASSIIIVFPRLFLGLFSPELIQYVDAFVVTAICLMVVGGIGPVTGLLQMSGNEKICNRNQWISIVAMIVTCILFLDKPLFAVYGLCVQNVVEGMLKYYSICRWFGKSIIPIKVFVLLWFPIALIYIVVDMFEWKHSYAVAILCALAVFAWNVGCIIKDPLIRKSLLGKIKSIGK